MFHEASGVMAECPFYRVEKILVERRRNARDGQQSPAPPVSAPWCAHLYSPASRFLATRVVGGGKQAAVCRELGQVPHTSAAPSEGLIQTRAHHHTEAWGDKLLGLQTPGGVARHVIHDAGKEQVVANSHEAILSRPLWSRLRMQRRAPKRLAIAF